MKTLLTIIVYCCMAVLSFAGALDKGNEFLKQNKYQEAIDEYESIVKNGYVGFELFFNLGTAYNKQGNMARAILNFEKASRFKPLNRAVYDELVLLNLKQRDKPSIYENTGLLRLIKKITYSLPVDVWAIFSLVFILVFTAGIFISYRLKTKGRNSSFSWVAIAGLIVSVYCIWNASSAYRGFRKKEAVVIPSVINVYDQQGLSTIGFTLHEGAKVSVVEKSDDKLFIRFEGQTGWIRSKDVENIHFN